jgi:hypothetical protein
MLIHGQSSQDQVLSGLRDLQSKIERIDANVQSQSASSISLPDTKDNERVLQSLQSLARAAETFHSSASTVAGSTVWGGSVFNDPLSRDEYRNIENWIPPPIEEEQTTDQQSVGTGVTSPSSELYSNPAASSTEIAAANMWNRPQDGDSDSDFETDLTKKFEDLALHKIKQRDYANAELFLRKVIDSQQQDGSSSRGLPMVKIKLATTCCFQGRWQEAEAIAMPIAMSKEMVDINAFHILHTLALRKLRLGERSSAVKCGKRAVWGKKRLLGKENVSYHESMALMARIFDLEGQTLEAEACRSFIPSHTPLDLDPLSYLFKTITGPVQEPVSPPPQSLTRPFENAITTGRTARSLNSSKSRLVICIDLGRSFMGVAYSVNNVLEVMTSWPGIATPLPKVPAILYYDTVYDKCVGWGVDIADAFKPTGYPKDNVQKIEWFSFRLAMEPKNHPMDVTNLPPLPEGKSPTDFVAEYLRLARATIQSEFKKKLGQEFDQIKNQIEWCFTVPPYVDERSVPAFQVAAAMAGYGRVGNAKDCTWIAALESGLVYTVSRLSLSIDPQDIFLCVKCGGGAVDLEAFEVSNPQPLVFRKLKNSSGDSCG